MDNSHFQVYTPFDQLTSVQRKRVVDFLYDHLGEYRDDKHSIDRALLYAMGDDASKGGFVLTLTLSSSELVGCVVVNKTGMGGYIPENILVYIAVHRSFRGMGYGKRLMKNAIKLCDGDIALHVEPENPAKFLYESVGFINKYLEMRLKRSPTPIGTQQKSKSSDADPSELSDNA